MMKKFCVAFVLSALSVSLPAQELFVSPTGDFMGQEAYRTISEGIAAMSAGDTLTIAPGEYPENLVIRPFPGDSTAKTRIRAYVPGGVHLCGGDGMFIFRILPGSNYTYVSRVRQNVTGVCELDTFTHLVRVDDPALLENRRGSYCYVPEISRLLISSGDGNAPKYHKYCVSFRPAPGISVEGSPDDPVKNLVISGIFISGFHATDSSAAGIRARYAENLGVGFCSIFDNDCGVDFENCQSSRIVSCNVYGNNTCNIRFSPGQGNGIRDCRSFYSAAGIIPDGAAIEKSISFYNGVDCVGEADPVVAADRMRERFSPETLRKNCVDPDQMDFRLQENGGLEGVSAATADDVCFLSENGDDGNSGKSISAPWKSFKNVPENATVYMLPGKYDGGIAIRQAGLKIKSYGNGEPAMIVGGQNGITVHASEVLIDRIAFRDQTGAAIAVESSNVQIRRCAFLQMPAGILAFRRKNLTFCHNSFDKSVKQPLRCYDCTGISHSNIFATQVNALPGFYSNNNAFFVNNIPVAETNTVRRVPAFIDAEKGDFFQKKASQYSGRGWDGLPIGIYLLNGTPATNIFDVARDKNEEGELLLWKSGNPDDVSTFRYARNSDDAQWIELPVECNGLVRRVVMERIPSGVWKFELTGTPAKNRRFVPYCGAIEQNPREEGSFTVR
ncbi:MAG: right-handed parallel beta-helix repeat-containing protein [Victivallaceae bacterium]|nr:right-handed parallel beta-helix repeat-containing protein [Victivallaceae bacterium]